MCRFRLGVVIAAVFFLLPIFLCAQKIDSMMRVYADQFPQEKIYVQFDKNIYTPGETIWYKAYLFTGSDPSLISKNFYAELSDATGLIVQKKTAAVVEASAAGSFDIPTGFKGNHFHFRAYTSWMLNFDTAFLFEKDIRIVTKDPDSAGHSSYDAEEYLQFFPEGGDVVAGLENNIAFKATDQYGTPIAIKGVLKDASGKDVLEFSPLHDGMGKFLLIPDAGDSFYAVWKDTRGKEHRAEFPPVKPEGITLRIMNANKKVIFSVARSNSTSTRNDLNRLTIIAHMNQNMVYKALINLQDNPISSGAVPVDQLPTGVLQVTIFNANNQPLAERVVFVNNKEFEFSANVYVQSKVISKRSLISMDIEIPDTLKSNLSVSVTDMETDGKKKNEDNIISRLLLTGELRGYVYNPYYYFSNGSDSTRSHLDLVMLTHGWRRFKWEQLALGKTPIIKYPNQDYLAIMADVLGVDATRISNTEAINIILRKKDSSVQMLDVPKLNGGKFGIAGLIFYDTAKAYYQFNVNRKLSGEAAIVFKNGLITGYKQVKPLRSSFTGWTAEDSALFRKNKFVLEEYAKIKPELDKRVQTLAAVTVKGRQKSPAQKLDEKYASGMFAGGDYTFDIMNDPIAAGYPDVFYYVQSKVGGIQVGTDQTGATYLTWRGVRTTLFLDEMQVTPAQIRSTVTVPNIAMIKVYRPGSTVTLGGGAGGAVAIYTRKGGDRIDDATLKGLDVARIIGYSAVKQFYSPDYLQKSELDDVEDVRTTLYWNPFLFTDKSNKRTTINFYNNDFSKKLRVVLEGVNADGKLTRVEQIIQ
jgi:hypothetical protein